MVNESRTASCLGLEKEESEEMNKPFTVVSTVNSLNFSESGWWGRILSAMKVLITVVIGLLVVGCGKKEQPTDTNQGNNTPAKTAKQNVEETPFINTAVEPAKK